MESPGEQGGHPIQAARQGDGWHIIDGHVRLQRAVLNGERSIWVEVWDGRRISELIQVPVVDLLREAP
jgi:hypothetical protein